MITWLWYMVGQSKIARQIPQTTWTNPGQCWSSLFCVLHFLLCIFLFTFFSARSHDSSIVKGTRGASMFWTCLQSFLLLENLSILQWWFSKYSYGDLWWSTSNVKIGIQTPPGAFKGGQIWSSLLSRGLAENERWKMLNLIDIPFQDGYQDL